MKQIICDLCKEPIYTGDDLAAGKLGNRYEITVTRHIFLGIRNIFSQGTLDLHDECRLALAERAGVKLPQ